MVLLVGGFVGGGCSSSPPQLTFTDGTVGTQGCSQRTIPSGSSAVLVGGTVPVGGGDFVTDLPSWKQQSAAAQAGLETQLQKAAATVSSGACVQTTASVRVGVRRAPGATLDAVQATAPAALAQGCAAGPSGTTVCNVLYGFGRGTTPLSVTGRVQYAGTPVCVDYSGGQLCTGWFGAWGADGTVGNGNTGSGIGTSALSVVTVGTLEAEMSSYPSAIYVSRAPSGVMSAFTVSSWVTLLDMSLSTVPASLQCQPTSVSFGVVTPNESSPDLYSQAPSGCVDEASFGAGAGTAGAVYAGLHRAQRDLVAGRGPAALSQATSAAIAAHQALIATPHTGLPAAGAGSPTSSALLDDACPILEAAVLGPATSAVAGANGSLTCSQVTLPVWHDVVPGQSLVSAQLTTRAISQSAGGAGSIHVLAAFDTVDVQECWPAADCSGDSS